MQLDHKLDETMLSEEDRAKIERDHSEYVLIPWSVQSAVKPAVITRAKGVYLWDAGGKRYLDLVSQLKNSNIGHQHPKVIEAIKRQAETLTYMAPSFATEPRARLAKMIAEITPGDLKMTFFTNGGAESTENAMKIARAYTGKEKIIGRRRAYHGATYGSISVAGDNKNLDPELPGSVIVPDAYCYRCSFGLTYPSCGLRCAEHIREVIQYEGPQTVAAVILETITGGNGIIVPPDGYLQKVRQICTEMGVLFIADEVMTGFGRTGKWFAVDNWGVVPDIMTFAKGVNSGYVPLGGVVVSEKIGDWYNDKMLWAGLTYSGHALACAAAVATIEAYKDERIIENAAKMGKILKRELLALQEKHPSVGEVRSLGLFAALELVKNRQTKEPLAPVWHNPSGDSSVAAAMVQKCSDLGAFAVVRWSQFHVAPPLIIDEEQLNEAVAIIDKALDISDAAYTGK